MGEFEDLRDQLAQRRVDREAASSDELRAAEAVVGLRRRLGAAKRATAADDADTLASLEREHAEAVKAAASARDQLSVASAAESAAADLLVDYTNPLEGIERIDDHTPILLFPLRIETRFKSSAAGVQQLWVRVYPDTCLVDGFEATLSATEVANGTAFWGAVWRAAGDEGRERAAWRELVAACGAGRAGWVVRTLVPKNPADKPEPADATLDLIVVATGPQPAELAAYWGAVWSAQGDVTALQQARDALEGALGSAEADRIAAGPPVNVDDPPPDGLRPDETTPRVTVLQLPDAAEVGARTTTWSGAPRVDTLPDRFVLLGYDSPGDTPSVVEVGAPIPGLLQVGPDPNAAPADQLKPVGDDPEHPDTLQIPDALRWMFDFERALDVGMAFRFDLTAAQAAGGFARLLVVGVRLTDPPGAGSARLNRLVEHHLHSRAGLELLREGTPTNNTEQHDAGYSWRDDSDASFQPLFKQQPQYTRVAEPSARRDGQRLADALGLADDLAARIPGAGSTDRIEAQAMQIALWPATVGYLMDTLLAPVFSAPTIAATRQFFTRFVSGRGPLPTLRVGDQPYGIQPAVALRSLDWFPKRSIDEPHLAATLARLVRQVEEDWAPLVDNVSRIGGGGQDSHQELLDVIGLHATSAEFYPLTADSLDHKAHELSFFGGGFIDQLFARFPQAEALDLLRRLGFTGDDVPDALTRVYHEGQKPLDGPLVDDAPLSEVTSIGPSAGGRNYIAWLADAAADSITAVQSEQGFDSGRPPNALLYLLLRHALQLSFREAAIGLLAAVEPSDSVALRREPPFVHIDADTSVDSESRYAELYTVNDRVTGVDGLTIGDYIARNVRALESTVLPEHLEALDLLATVPTARLERLFAEHIDTASYRLDAWRTGLISWALDQLRAPPVATASVAVGPSPMVGRGPAGGVHLGAYGWVEDLRPENKTLTPVTLDPDLAADVDKGATVPLVKDPTNLGLVHAPSINHAATAAVLRNAHVAHSGAMSVDLSSRRVRHALAVLEGMREGQSIGALLGYQLERHLHDNGPLTVRALVYPLRREYPLAANQILSTATTDGVAQESIAAINVVDGRKLLHDVDESGDDVYPFGNARLPRRPAAEEGAVTAAVRHIRDVNDAVADLVVAEGVHQAVTGNFDRAAGTLEAFAKGNHPPEFDVIRTPRPGTGLTLRVAIHVPTTGGAGSPVPGVAMTPLASADPALNRLLAGMLPTAATSVGVSVRYGDATTGNDVTITITQDDLGLQPADLLYRADTDTDQALSDLDERILEYLHATRAVRLDRPILIRHTEPVAGVVTFFELEALLRSLRRVVVGGRPLGPADLMRQGDARSTDAAAVTVPRARLADARSTLAGALAPTLVPLRATLADATSTIDDAVSTYVAAVGPFATYRIRHAGTGFALEWRAATYAAVTDAVARRVAVWDGRLDHFDELLTEYATLSGSATAEDRLRRLRTAEVLVSTTVGSGLDPAAHLASLTPKRTSFQTRRNALDDVATAPRATLAELVADAEVLADVSAFDPESLDLTAHVDEIARFRRELATRVDALDAEVDDRVAAAGDALFAHDSGPEAARAGAVVDGLRALFGEDLVVVPTIGLPPAAATELATAWAHSTSGDLTRHLTDPPPSGSGRDFPEEDWLHGIARVRDKLHHLENVVLLASGLPGATAPTLTPVQLPHEDGQPWLAMEVPADFEITSERLLYNVVHDGTFDPAQPLAGLLVDDWTEVIPDRVMTTGVAFHHDRPNAEPPQAWLLALPASFTGSWSWHELVGAVTETLDAAKLRALEPAHFDATPYAVLLPATHSAWTFPEISISNNLQRNVRLYERVAERLTR